MTFKLNTTRTSRIVRSRIFVCSLLVLGSATLLPVMEGCTKPLKMPWKKTIQDAQLDQIPPIKVDSLNGHHLLMMQSPNPGWSFIFDRNERLRESTRVFITITKPDPSFVYPQVIVEKTLLTNISEQRALEIYARVIESGENTKLRDHAPLDLETNP